MAKNGQPKVADLVETLLVEMEDFKKTNSKTYDQFIKANSKYIDFLVKSIKNLQSVEIEIDLDGIKKQLQTHRGILENDFETFNSNVAKVNENILTTYKKLNSKRWLYLIILNILLFAITGFSSYFALKNTIDKDRFNKVQKERSDFESDAKLYKDFITRNQKTIDEFKDWIK